MGAFQHIEQTRQVLEAASFGDVSWERVLATISAAAGGTRGIMLGGNATGSYSYSCAFNHNEDVGAAYNDHYHAFDPRVAPARAIGIGETALGQSLMPNSAFRKSEYFDAISLKGDVADSVFGVISNDMELGRRTISVQRGFAEEYFSDTEASVLRACLPALDAALRNSLRVAKILAAERGDGAVVYGLLDPALDFQLLPGSEQWGDQRLGALHIANGRLFCAARELTAALKSAARRAREGKSATLKCGAVSLRFDPVPDALAWYRAGKEQVFLAIARETMCQSPEFALFAESFGLTRREADVLATLATTDTVPQAANKLGMSAETARWHVKNICTKTGHAGVRNLVDAARANDLSNLS